MSVDYRMRRIRNIIKGYDKKEVANIGDLVAAFDAIKAEVAIYEAYSRLEAIDGLRKKKEMVE